MPGGAALSNGVAAGGAVFASSLGVGPGVHRVILCQNIFSATHGLARDSCIVGPFSFLSGS